MLKLLNFIKSFFVSGKTDPVYQDSVSQVSLDWDENKHVPKLNTSPALTATKEVFLDTLEKFVQKRKRFPKKYDTFLGVDFFDWIAQNGDKALLDSGKYREKNGWYTLAKTVGQKKSVRPSVDKLVLERELPQVSNAEEESEINEGFKDQFIYYLNSHHRLPSKTEKIFGYPLGQKVDLILKSASVFRRSKLLLTPLGFYLSEDKVKWSMKMLSNDSGYTPRHRQPKIIWANIKSSYKISDSECGDHGHKNANEAKGDPGALLNSVEKVILEAPETKTPERIEVINESESFWGVEFLSDTEVDLTSETEKSEEKERGKILPFRPSLERKRVSLTQGHLSPEVELCVPLSRFNENERVWIGRILSCHSEFCLSNGKKERLTADSRSVVENLYSLKKKFQTPDSKAILDALKDIESKLVRQKVVA